jgi:hypothetical protein
LKIGILTFHKANNYGAVLQAYALQKHLLKSGFDAEIIDYRLSPKMNQVKLNFFDKIARYSYNPVNYMVRKVKQKKFQQFRDNYIRISNKTFFGDDQILSNPPNYDAYIVGSDQIWNTSISNNSKAFYLHFVKKQKKIAYAASFGKSQFDEDEINNIQEYLIDFDFLSVREHQHQKMLSDMFGINAKVTLDPVFLLSKNEWIELSKPFRLPKKYILVYVLEYSEELFKHAGEMAKKLRCDVIYISLIEKKINGKVLNGIGPREYLYAFANANYICTNSFHGTAFSIIFEKNFTVVKHTTRNSRIENIIKLAGLKDRFYDVDTDKMEMIDYKEVNNKILVHINESKKFIADALDVNKE